MLAGKEFTEYAGDAAAVVHCGACAITRGQMLARLDEARAHGLPMTNYGMCISLAQGVLERVLSPFRKRWPPGVPKRSCRITRNHRACIMPGRSYAWTVVRRHRHHRHVPRHALGLQEWRLRLNAPSSCPGSRGKRLEEFSARRKEEDR